jgi:ERCC4-type nuclease
MAKVLVELLEGEHLISVPPEEADGDCFIRYTRGDTFEIDTRALEPLKDKIRLVKREEDSEEESSSVLPEIEVLVLDESQEQEEEEIPLERLNTNIATLRLLKTIGKFTTIQQVAEASEEDLCRIRGIGPKIATAVLKDARSAVLAANDRAEDN